MSKCDCWHEVQPFCYNDKINGVCYGTKEREYCQCNGDDTKCDFYPEKRKENKTMKTLEMMNAAKENGKTYVAGAVYYSTKTGFVDEAERRLMGKAFECINDLFDDSWKWEVVENAMTRCAAERKYGIKIIG